MSMRRQKETITYPVVIRIIVVNKLSVSSYQTEKRKTAIMNTQLTFMWNIGGLNCTAREKMRANE